MHSLRTKSTLLTICGISIAVIVITVLSVLFIIRTEQNKSDQLLLLLCETGERNLDYYFDGVEKSIDKVALFAEDDIDGLKTKQLERHVKSVEEYFDIVANRTNGVLTYYYRIDPTVSDTVKGFWYTNLNGEGFEEHEVTDITQYDTEDTSKLVWFTVPKATGKSIWLPPYITDNLDVEVLSYNIPIYWRDQFVGVVGIEIDYSTMADQVSNIRLYDNGYAFINDEEGKLFFHPYIDVASEKLDPARKPKGIVSESSFFHYEYEGVEKKAVWMPLTNGMRLNVAVPVSEINGDWQKLTLEILMVSIIVLLLLSFITMWMTGFITKPLQQLTAAAEQADRGNYDFDLDYDKDDEVGRLTRTFKRLTAHVEDHINELNNRVFVDALTSVQNKGAYSARIEELQKKMDDTDDRPEFAIGIFDCDDLKKINDVYGHEKGDVYLKTASRLICRVYQHSPVFRIGGDEFAVILQNEDYENRDELDAAFEEKKAEACAAATEEWEKVSVAKGFAVYDPKVDRSVNDTVLRADATMYANKREAKAKRTGR